MPRYRASINGFWCHSETWDDLLNGDGWHDEVFISVSTKIADHTGAIVHSYESVSELMGDVNRIPNRIKAGSGSINGGIVTGDKFPNAVPWQRSGPLNSLPYPPYTIWEGDLNPGSDVVMLTPTIWEWDPGVGFWDGWLTWQVGVDANYGMRAKEIVGKIWPVAAPVFDAVSLVIQTANTLAGLWGPLGRSMNRPIGLQRVPNDPNGASFNPKTIALTVDTADYLINNSISGRGNGVVELLYTDDPFLRGSYSIFVEIERLSAAAPQEQNDWRWCNKCQGLFEGRHVGTSHCPAGGTHDGQNPIQSSDYVLTYGVPADANRQSDWRWCNKCKGLFWGGGQAASVCPAGGAHEAYTPASSFDYVLPFGVAANANNQGDWRWCNRCQGLFWGGGLATSVCPAGGGRHDPLLPFRSSEYVLKHI